MESTNFTWPYDRNYDSLPRPIYQSPFYGLFQYHSAALFLVLTIVSLTVAYLSACPYRTQLFTAQEHQTTVINTVPFVPHWIPYLGLLIPFAYDGDGLLKAVNDHFPWDIFALKLFGSRHYVLEKPSLVGKISANVKDVVSDDVLFDMIRLAFGLHRKWQQSSLRDLPRLRKAFVAGLMQGPGLRHAVESQIRYTATILPDLISPPDRFRQPRPWEVAGNVVFSPATQYGKNSHAGDADIDLYPLIRHALGHCSTRTMLGKQFLIDRPEALDLLFTFDEGFLTLASGIPSWAPIPHVWRAVKARNQLLRHLAGWIAGYKAHAPGKDFSDVGLVVRQVLEVLESTSMDLDAYASIILIIFWALNANANGLVFWMIIRAAADPPLLSRIRAEIKPYVKALAVPGRDKRTDYASLTIAEHPKLSIDIDGLTNQCPLLKATYLECNRVHSRPVSFRKVINDLILVDPTPSISSSSSSSSPVPSASAAASHQLLASSYLHIPHFLHHTDPSYFPDPETFRPERFLTTTEEGETKVDPKTLRPYGIGASMCKGRLFAEKEVLGFVAGFLMCWDIEALEERKGRPNEVGEGERKAKGEKVGLRVPGNVKTSAISRPDDDCRVRITRRLIG
ncbi:MAG: hypothetical protein Q9207_002490 [Kuettlingeria erythrocarpa]